MNYDFHYGLTEKQLSEERKHIKEMAVTGKVVAVEPLFDKTLINLVYKNDAGRLFGIILNSAEWSK